HLLVEAGDDGINVRIGGIEVDDQRTDLGAQEMVGAGGAQRRQRTEIVGIDEFEDGSAVVEMAEFKTVFGDEAADLWHEARGDGAAGLSVERGDSLATENGLALGLFLKPLDGLIDDGNGGLVAF